MADSCHQVFTAFSPPSCLYHTSNNILPSLQPLQAHNTASITTELEGHGIWTRIRNYSTLNVVCTKVAISATVKFRDKSSHLSKRMGYQHNIFHECANGVAVVKFVKNLFYRRILHFRVHGHICGQSTHRVCALQQSKNKHSKDHIPVTVSGISMDIQLTFNW